MDVIYIFAIAIFLDATAGDPPNTWHPVAWIGKLITFQSRYMLSEGNRKQFIFGTFTVILTSAVFTVLSHLLLSCIFGISVLWGIAVSGLLLKLMVSLKGLTLAAVAVKDHLDSNNITGAREAIGALVSRDPANLDERQLVAATIESTAENICDSFIAPLFYFLIFGVPGAVAYRIINTYDSMIGYHGKWEYYGKFAARLDDAANFIPARISAVLIMIASLFCKSDVKQSWHILTRDHGKTESPNAGWTMSVMAGSLGVQLEKSGHYCLGDIRQELTLTKIDSSINLITTAALTWIMLVLIIQGVASATTQY